VRRYRRRVTAPRLRWTRLALAGALPLAVAAAWIPLRDRLPNTDLALLLVLVIAMVGWLIGPAAAVCSAVVASVAFDVLDAPPYGALTMARGNDISTALILLATGGLVGAGAARLARYHDADGRRTDALAVVMEASRLTATGEEQRLVTAALGAELKRALQLVDWEVHCRPPSGTRPSVARDGQLVGLVGSVSSGTSPQIDLPIWRKGEVVAHYRLTLGPTRPSQAELRVAVSLADQAGAAMAETQPDPPPPSPRPPMLRLVRRSTGAPGGAKTTGAAPPHINGDPQAENPDGRLAAAP
jgi:hypothetical protein